MRSTNTYKIRDGVLYTLVTNGLILLVALVQNWNFAELFLFLFLQSILVGLIVFSTLLLINLKEKRWLQAMYHPLFFLLHFYFFIGAILFGVVYESGYLSLQTLNDGLATFFTVFLSDNIIISTQFNLYAIVLVLGIFLIIEALQYYQKCKKFNTYKNLAEIHISPYGKHLLLFFFLFHASVILIKPFVEVGYFSTDQGVLITFFTTVTVIDISIKGIAKTLG